MLSSRVPINAGHLRLPDFIAVGPGRTGTTWLHQVLKGHVGLPEVKEIQFFKWYYHKGLGWYASHFTKCPPGRPVGEICPVYFHNEMARSRIVKDLPRCKIICSLRDPVDRAYSHYRMQRPLSGLRSFEQAVEVLPDILEGSCYARHLQVWRENFGSENVLVLFYEDLQANPQQFVDSICSFIGVESLDLSASAIAQQRINAMERAPRSRRLGMAANMIYFKLREYRCHRVLNAFERSRLWDFCFSGGPKYDPISADAEKQLRIKFLPEIEQLEGLIGRDLSAWKRGRTSETVAGRGPRAYANNASPG